MNYHSFNSRPAMQTQIIPVTYSTSDYHECEKIWRLETNSDFSEAIADKKKILPIYRLRKPEIKTLEMFTNRDVTLSKLEEFKNDCVPGDIRIKERLLRQGVLLDPFLETHIRGQIIQMDLGEDPRCRFPNMDQIAWLAAQDVSNFGRKCREINAVQGETFNTDIVSEALFPISGFDDKKIRFWFVHQKIWRKILNDELEEFLMINRFTRMKMELIGYHSAFWTLSDQAMSALNTLGYLVYSLNIPIQPLNRVTDV